MELHGLPTLHEEDYRSGPAIIGGGNVPCSLSLSYLFTDAISVLVLFRWGSVQNFCSVAQSNNRFRTTPQKLFRPRQLVQAALQIQLKGLPDEAAQLVR